MGDDAGDASGGGAMGYWGASTASVDWCEDNYEVTHYIAEFWNTMSSIPIFLAGAIGAYWSVRQGLERRFTLCFLAVAFIGIGSALFHGTLLYWGQFLDEVPMIYGVTMFAWSALETHELADHKVRWLPYALAAYATIFTAVYFLAPNYFVIFIVLYACTVAYVCIRSYRLYCRARDPGHKLLFWLAVGFYVGGVVCLWVPENLLCSRTIEPFQLHAWFHLTSTVGPYSWVLFAIFSRYESLKRPVTIEAGTASSMMLPVVRADIPTDKSH